MKPLLLAFACLLAACTGHAPDPPAAADYTAAPAPYLVLAQKAITYQADEQLDDWAHLLADDVEYEGTDTAHLVGKTAVLAYWQQQRDTSRIRRVRLSGFSLLPVQTGLTLPLANLPGVYVAAVFRRRVEYATGRADERPVCLWLHFNEQKLIDRLYSFQSDRAPP